MSKVRVYVLPFDADGNYLSEYVEVTDDVLTLSDIVEGIDNVEFDVGSIRVTNLKITLKNLSGKYSDVTNIQSIFASKRKDSKVKITWNRLAYPLVCGFFKAGTSPLGVDNTIFEGLIKDVNSKSSIKDQVIEFSVLGFDSALYDTEVPYSSVNATDDYTSVLYTCLNTEPFKNLVTVSLANINPGNDPQIDSKANLENKTVGEILKGALLDSLSVFYIKNGTAYVSDRTPGASISKTFYGQGSIIGIENIIDIPGYRDGVNRVKNFWRWRDTTLVSSDPTSVELYGVQQKELSSDLIDSASTSKINTILGAYKDDFRNAKMELDLVTPLEVDTLSLNLLDRVAIDYPTVFVPADNNVLPRYGLEVYGAVRYPYGRWDLTLTTSTNFKILQKKTSLQNNTITLKLREI